MNDFDLKDNTDPAAIEAVKTIAEAIARPLAEIIAVMIVAMGFGGQPALAETIAPPKPIETAIDLPTVLADEVAEAHRTIAFAHARLRELAATEARNSFSRKRAADKKYEANASELTAMDEWLLCRFSVSDGPFKVSDLQRRARNRMNVGDIKFSISRLCERGLLVMAAPKEGVKYTDSNLMRVQFPPKSA